ncbi:APC family permease [Clostridium oryzae]|uniref:Low-affinity putrescine importer PlaP n=1 Tax=Clostridium oryzae TaxID=1450648 RepID=A0A1V4IM57_9CLOT|nr:APC family permease [Clostridium oryzae]OPJ60855.1 Low-affinity putrescine importer PlaP [Clostridium oryzae]
MIEKFFNLLTGEPLANEMKSHEKYNVPFGLAIMTSDSVSSVAYAAEEILIVLLPALGVASYHWLGYVSLAIIGLLLVLTTSYIQIIKEFPGGGGAYVVTKQNIGILPGLVAGAALLIDYIMTVAVSASSGVAAIISAYPNLMQYKVPFVVGLIILLCILNLRGVSESSKIFSIPTYLFIFSMLFMIIFGIIKYAMYGAPDPMLKATLGPGSDLSLFLILKAFSSGCTALTGLEAVSNSVPNFKEPSAKNATKVMLILTCLIFVIFGGTSLLANFYHPIYNQNTTVLAQIAYGVFGGYKFMFYVIQYTTAVILIMACNTAFTGFPMLMYIIGKDGYAPRQFTVRGKRLSFSAGIIFLAGVAIILTLIFQGDTHRLIPLYSVGVFLSFVLAQTSMVIHWRKSKAKGWKKGIAINGIGAIITFITTCVIVKVKFGEGAWIVSILIPVLVAFMILIKSHYNYVAECLKISGSELPEIKLNTEYNHVVVVPIASINKATVNALKYARSISPDVIALNVSPDKDAIEKLEKRWHKMDTDILLVSKYSSYRAIVGPLISYIGAIVKASSDSEKITVVLPEFITHQWLGGLLHNHTGFVLREALLKYNNVVIATYPYHFNTRPLKQFKFSRNK